MSSNQFRTSRTRHIISRNTPNMTYMQQKAVKDYFQESGRTDISSNPLRTYTKIVDMLTGNYQGLSNKPMKEEAQQCNFDDFTNGTGTAVNATTPYDQTLHDQFTEHRNSLKEPHQYPVDTTNQTQQRSQTAASQYLTQARLLNQSSRQAYNIQKQQTDLSNQQQSRNYETSTNFTKVRMTRSIYKNHQVKLLQEIGVSDNVRPLSKQSGMGRIVYRSTSGQQEHNIVNVPKQQFNIVRNQRRDPSRNESNLIAIGNSSSQQTVNTLQTIRKGKDGAYISFQTNVDNSQAIIPMILSNEDLLRTQTEDPLNMTSSSSVAEDSKKNNSILNRSRPYQNKSRIYISRENPYDMKIVTDLQITKNDFRKSNEKQAERFSRAQTSSVKERPQQKGTITMRKVKNRRVGSDLQKSQNDKSNLCNKQLICLV